MGALLNITTITNSSSVSSLFNNQNILNNLSKNHSVLNKKYDVIYGPSAQGKLSVLADKLGSKLLSDYGSPYDNGFSSWIDFSKSVLDKVSAKGGQILFDLSNISNVQDVLQNKGPYADTITSQELRYIMNNWDKFSNSVTFCINEIEVGAPW